ILSCRALRHIRNALVADRPRSLSRTEPAGADYSHFLTRHLAADLPDATTSARVPEWLAAGRGLEVFVSVPAAPKKVAGGHQPQSAAQARLTPTASLAFRAVMCPDRSSRVGERGPAFGRSRK